MKTPKARLDADRKATPKTELLDPDAWHDGFCVGREVGRKEGITAVIAALKSYAGESTYGSMIHAMRSEALIFLNSPEGRAAVDAELKKNGGGA